MTVTRYRVLDRSSGLSRRDLLRGTALAGAAVAAGSFPAPFVHAADPITLRYAGTGVNAFNEISQKVKEDLGIEIQYTTLTSDDVVKKVKLYDQIVPIFTKGELPDGSKVSHIGTAPIKVA